MQIDEAIKILGKRRINLKTKTDYDYLDAIMLSIEALKRLKNAREDSNTSDTFIVRALPGETEEKEAIK